MPIVLRYLIGAFALTLLVVIYTAFSRGPGIGFLNSIGMLIVGPILMGGGAYIGHLVRDYTRPTAFMSSGLGHTLKTKLFWAAGPQLIGAFLGMMATDGLFGHPPSARQSRAVEVSRPKPDFVYSDGSGYAAPVEPSQVAQDAYPAAADAASNSSEPSINSAQVGESVSADGQPQPEIGLAQPQDGQGSAHEAPAVKPSFDCLKATSRVEMMICGSPELAAIDIELSNSYRDARKCVDDRLALQQSQRRWMSFRDRCDTEDCLAKTMSDRRHVLLSACSS